MGQELQRRQLPQHHPSGGWRLLFCLLLNLLDVLGLFFAEELNAAVLDGPGPALPLVAGLHLSPVEDVVGPGDQVIVGFAPGDGDGQFSDQCVDNALRASVIASLDLFREKRHRSGECPHHAGVGDRVPVIPHVLVEKLLFRDEGV